MSRPTVTPGYAPVETLRTASSTPGMKELRHLYDHHPELWARMLELQALPGKVTEKFNRTQRFSDIDAMFREEDQENGLRQKAA